METQAQDLEQVPGARSLLAVRRSTSAYRKEDFGRGYSEARDLGGDRECVPKLNGYFSSARIQRPNPMPVNFNRDRALEHGH